VSPARRARGAVFVVFFINGLVFGSWAARIPAVRDRLGLTDGQLGFALACVAIGAIVAMPLAGALAARTGSRAATRGALALLCVMAGVIALAPSLPVLAVLALAYGASAGALDVTMNTHGVAVERRYGRPILSGFHAGFSVGGLVGAALGALAAAAGLDARIHLAVVAGASAVLGLTWSRRFLPGSEDATGRGEPILARPPRRLWALGALAFSCLLVEGASGDWSGVYIKDELGASPALAALGFTAFSVTMTLGRVFGDRLVMRFGPVAVVRAGGTLAATGFAVALLVARPWSALLGFACLGAGMSSVIPIVFRAAGGVRGMNAGVALAAASSTGYFGLMAGPPIIGGLAELAGLPAALAVLVLLGLAVVALAPTTRTCPAVPGRTEVAIA
jgi:MFS family permease